MDKDYNHSRNSGNIILVFDVIVTLLNTQLTLPICLSPHFKFLIVRGEGLEPPKFTENTNSFPLSL